MMRMMNNRTFWRSKRFFIRVSFRSCYCCGFRYRTGSICARIRLDSSANPPNGSWGMVKVQPTKASPCPNPPNGSWGMVKVQPQSPNAVGRRPGFNDPPTAVEGIQEKTVCRCRSDFNHPPTAVGGIQPTLLNPYPGAHARGTVSEALKVYLPIASCLCANSRVCCGDGWVNNAPRLLNKLRDLVERLKRFRQSERDENRPGVRQVVPHAQADIDAALFCASGQSRRIIQQHLSVADVDQQRRQF